MKKGNVILRQLEALGCSADWSRTYFTLDEDLSRAVREVFVRLAQGQHGINETRRPDNALGERAAGARRCRSASGGRRAARRYSWMLDDIGEG